MNWFTFSQEKPVTCSKKHYVPESLFLKSVFLGELCRTNNLLPDLWVLNTCKIPLLHLLIFFPGKELFDSVYVHFSFPLGERSKLVGSTHTDMAKSLLLSLMQLQLCREICTATTIVFWPHTSIMILLLIKNVVHSGVIDEALGSDTNDLDLENVNKQTTNVPFLNIFTNLNF